VLLNVVICLSLILTSPVWGPLSGLLRWLFTVFIYDVDTAGGHPAPFIISFLWRIVIRGVVGITTSLIAACVIHPTIAINTFLLSTAAATLRYVYYSLFHFLIVRPRAKVRT